MSAALLVINKKPKESQHRKRITDHVVSVCEEVYGAYYASIRSRVQNEACLVLTFGRQADQCFYQHTDGSWMVLEGVVFDLHETKRYSAQELWSLYQQNKEAFPNRLDGHFVVKWYDASTGTYHVINDFIKYKTNFIFENDEVLVFTPFAAICGAWAEAKVDPYALNEFMWRYYVITYRNLLEGVTKLVPATHYSYRDKLETDKYWDFPQRFTTRSFDESVDEMVESIQETARLIHDEVGPPCVDFTMGQDTRMLVSSYTSQDLSFKTSIFGKDDFFEVVETKKMAQRHGIDHHNIRLEKDYTSRFGDHFKRGVLLSSCEEPGYLVGRILYMRERQNEWGAASINGAEGQFYKNGLWDEQYMINLYREPKRFNIDLFLSMRALSKNYEDAHFSETYRRDIKAQSRSYLTEFIQGEIDSYADAPVAIQVDRFDINNWLNYASTANNACMSVIPSFSPLLLRRNLEKAVQIPVQWKFNLSRYMRHVVYAMDPELAAEKNDWAGVNMVPKKGLDWIPFYAKYYWAQSDRLRKKIGTKMGFKKKTALQNAWDYRPLFEDLISSEEMKAFLDYDSMHLSPLLDRTPWQKYIQSFQRPGVSMHRMENLMKLISVEIFMEAVEKFGMDNITGKSNSL